MAFYVNGKPCLKIHFAGIFGTGMSALAQHLRYTGTDVSGPDRLLGRPGTEQMARALRAMGIRLVPQDGSGLDGETEYLVLSTAIEEDNPDLAAARQVGAGVIHRSELLAQAVEKRRTVAVAGTSGKSTVTAMIFEFLSACGMSPSLVSGAPLVGLAAPSIIGNAYPGDSDVLVVEADESDGSLVRYRPLVGVVLNISKDHKPLPVLVELFRTFARQSETAILNADDPRVAKLAGSKTFGVSPGADFGADQVVLGPTSVCVTRHGADYRLPLPGRHNAENLLAALCVCDELGCPPADLVPAVAAFKGVDRRFTIHRTASGVTVVDDYAHNPAKIRAVVSAARGLGERVHVVYQPHGFAPTRFLRAEYEETFREIFGAGDTLALLPIYYAGGTAVKDVASSDLIEDLGAVDFHADAPEDPEAVLALLAERAKPGDVVLLLGARDPALPLLAKRMVQTFGGPA